MGDTTPPASDPAGSGWRTILGLTLAVLVVVALAPSERLPWSGLVHRFGGIAAPIIASVVLLIAARLLPVPAAVAAPRRDGVAMALGLLLVIEPLMHLAALWWSAQRPSPAVADAILPATGAGRWSVAAWLMWFEVLVLAPIAEECFFRGRLLPYLNTRLGRVSGVSITTLAFAVAHLQPMQAVLAAPLGLLLAWLRLRGGSLAGCIAAHSAHNLLFVALGPALIGLPTLAPIMLVGGLVIVALAWLHLGGGVGHWRPVLAAALVVAGATGVHLIRPWYRQVQDRWWVEAAHLLIVSWRIDNDELLGRLDGRLRTGILTPARRQALADAVRHGHCQTIHRQHLVLATLDPIGWANEAEPREAESLLEDLACAKGGGSRDHAALALGLRFPEAFARIVSNEPQLLNRWLPIPGAAKQGAVQLAATTDPLQRRGLLSAWERANPGRVIEVLLLLRPDEVTANDRRHLWTRYPDARRRLEALRATDPDRADAFGPGF